VELLNDVYKNYVNMTENMNQMKVLPELGSITHRQSGCFTQMQIDMGKLLSK